MRRLRFSTLATLAVASFAVIVGTASPATAAPVSDNFNRANSTDLGAGWVESGTDLAIAGNQLTNSASTAGFAQAVGGTGDTAQAEVVAAPAGNASAYAAVAVRVTDTTDMIMVRAQDDDGDGDFDHLVATRGNASGTVIFNITVTDFSAGSIAVGSDGTHLSAIVDVGSNGSIDVFQAGTSPTEAAGTGVGVGVTRNAKLDNFSSSDTALDTTTTLVSSANPSAVGASVTFTATVTATSGTPTGSVVFTVDGTDQAPVALASGQATFSTDTLTEGSHTIVARYQPDAFGFNTSQSSSLTQTVARATTTTLASSANPSELGQSVTFTATVTAASGTPTGTVTFSIDSSVSMPVTLDGNGQATFTTSLPVGTYTIGASYTPDSSTYLASTATTLTQVVQKHPTSTVLVSSQNPSVVGEDVQFTATVTTGTGTPTGTVTFSDDGTVLGTVALNAGSASLTTNQLAIGTHPMTATYNGDANYATSTDAVDQVVDPPPAIPDGRIRRGEQPLLGDDLHNDTGAGQTAAGSAPRRGTVAFRVSVQNDGTEPGTFEVQGQGSTNLFTVTYRNQAGTDITRQVVDGSYRVRNLAAGAIRVIRATVFVRPAADHGSQTTRAVTILGPFDTVDVVRFTARRP